MKENTHGRSTGSRQRQRGVLTTTRICPPIPPFGPLGPGVCSKDLRRFILREGEVRSCQGEVHCEQVVGLFGQHVHMYALVDKLLVPQLKYCTGYCNY